MSPTTAKVLWVVVPVSTAAAIFAIWYIYGNKPKKVYVSPQNPGSTPSKAILPAAASTAGQFPLQMGSRNNYVKTLQTALGVTADGIFGPVTQSALKAQFGMSSVADQNALNSIVNGSGASGQVSAPAQLLYSQFSSGSGPYDLQVQNKAYAEQVSEGADGSLNPTGTGFTVSPGEIYDGTVFTLDGSTELGMLILKVVSGNLQGEYTLDPSAITLVPHNNFSIIPSVNPNTGLTTL